MFVSRNMTREVVTATLDTPVPEVDALMRKHRVRHVPVVDGEGRLVGIVTDRDIRSAMPSKLLSEGAGQAEMAGFRESKARDIMTQKPHVITQAHTVQDALLLIDRYRVGALPVVDEDNRLIGILSVRDLLKSFVNVLGLGEPGTLLCILAPNRRGELKKIVDVITAEGMSTGSILVAHHWQPDKRAVFPYVFSIAVGPLKRKLREAGFEILDPMQWYLDNRGAVVREEQGG